MARVLDAYPLRGTRGRTGDHDDVPVRGVCRGRHSGLCIYEVEGGQEGLRAGEPSRARCAHRALADGTGLDRVGCDFGAADSSGGDDRGQIGEGVRSWMGYWMARGSRRDARLDAGPGGGSAIALG